MKEEHKRKIGEAQKRIGNLPPTRKGYKQSIESRLKMSISKKGKTSPRKGIKMTEEQKKKLSIAHKGKKLSDITKEKIGKANKGYKCIFWRGGITSRVYSVDWTKTLRRSIRERDMYTCKICGSEQEEKIFAVHHIDYDKKNCNPKNLITLCNSCHSKTNTKRKYWKKYFRENVKVWKK